MNTFDDMDLENMINNSLKNIDLHGDSLISTGSQQELYDLKKAQKKDSLQRKPVSEADFDRMEKNHPLNHRTLSLEKNIINTDKKLETLKRIIEHQNERISKLEEELDILRKHLVDNEISDEDISEQQP